MQTYILYGTRRFFAFTYLPLLAVMEILGRSVNDESREAHPRNTTLSHCDTQSEKDPSVT